MKEITAQAFDYMQGEKSINIPADVKLNVEKIADYSWKSFSISPNNKWYKMKDGCLLSKSGKRMYRYVGLDTKADIPEGVEYIANEAFLFAINVDKISIPKSVKKIKGGAFSFMHKAPKIKLSKDNPYYAMENKCIYEKETGRLVTADEEYGVITIPDSVTVIKGGVSYPGKKIIRMVFPNTLKELKGKKWNYSMYVNDDIIRLVFQGANPPAFSRHFILPHADKVFIFVPKGSGERYKDALSKTGARSYYVFER